MDLIKLITDKVKEVETSGKLDEIIEKNVLSCLEEIVKDSFQWNGEAKKSIKQALEGKLNISMEEVKLPQYGKLVSDIVNNQLNGTVIENLKTDIQETVNSITEVIDKKEWKLSEIISKYIDTLDKSYDGEMESQYGECSLFIKGDKTFRHIYFDKEEKEYNYRCENSLFIYESKLSSVTIEGKTFTPHAMYSMGDFERFMFKLYCNNVTIIIDEDKCDLNYYREDCD